MDLHWGDKTPKVTELEVEWAGSGEGPYTLYDE
jgi:hypothetical protein